MINIDVVGISIHLDFKLYDLSVVTKTKSLEVGKSLQSNLTFEFTNQTSTQ